MRSIDLKSLFVLSLTLLLSACSTEDSEAPGTITEASRTVTVDWTAPLAREDNTTLLLSDIAGYRVYYGKTSGDYPDQIEIIDSSADSTAVTASPGS
jgi:hypothetical protein